MIRPVRYGLQLSKLTISEKGSFNPKLVMHDIGKLLKQVHLPVSSYTYANPFRTLNLPFFICIILFYNCSAHKTVFTPMHSPHSFVWYSDTSLDRPSFERLPILRDQPNSNISFLYKHVIIPLLRNHPQFRTILFF